ncbi:MAG TPA: DUF6101 family protein [Xanthobacteraceae bacterium]|nr:DUF6101 family protein [Xanthobacteraceae bacterium]
MSAGGTTPAGSSLRLRLDPLSLPVRFRTVDATADGRVRVIELHRDVVVLRRSVRGARIKLSLPIMAFSGIVMRLKPPDEVDARAIAVDSAHRDPMLSVPLFAAPDANDVLAEWHMPGRIFGLLLLVAGDDGQLREPFRRLGAIRVSDPCERVRRRNQLRRRRPSI